MGSTNLKTVQFVISHLEGCAGNFLGRLIADCDLESQDLFRTDKKPHPTVLSVNQCTKQELDEKFDQHLVVVTHNFDLIYLKNLFPTARFIGIYPYSHMGNVLYNICMKKLTVTLDNKIDNYLIQIKQWHQYLLDKKPTFDCVNFWDLTNIDIAENLCGQQLTPSQQNFFYQYWNTQLKFELNMPGNKIGIQQLINQCKIDNFFNEWAVAWVIYVYEWANQLKESSRLWSIDVEKFQTWSDVIKIEEQYQQCC